MPAFILALAPNTRRYIPGFLRRVVHFALPGGIATALSILADSWLLPKFMGWDAQHSAAQLGMLRGVNAIILLMMASSYWRAWPGRSTRGEAVWYWRSPWRAWPACSFRPSRVSSRS